MNKHPGKIIVGVSSCLLGQEVRFDGSHKNNAYIRKTLGRYFEFVPFCPEVASGMGIPRPPIQLQFTKKGIRCVGAKDHTLDVTDQLLACAARQNDWLEGLCGYILKKSSPSCGMERVKIYKDNSPESVGSGIFAKYIQEHFPLLPIEEEGRLYDPYLRENFIQRVYVMQRWIQLNAAQVTLHQLTVFHSRHKLITMSHDQNQARHLSRLVASATKENLIQVTKLYGLNLMACLKKTACRDNHVKVLQHIQSFLKTKLEPDDKAELIETIDRYHLGMLPLIVPITLLKHHFRNTPDPFIEQSLYMSPYPEELNP